MTGPRAIDPTTGLLMSAAFEAMAQQECARAARFGRSVGVAFVRIACVSDDRTVSDDTLARVGLRVTTLVRLYDTVARWGVDQLAILYPEASLRQARRATQRVVLNTMQPERGVTVHAGVTALAPHSPEDVATLIREAERTLSSALSHDDHVRVMRAA